MLTIQRKATERCRKRGSRLMNFWNNRSLMPGNSEEHHAAKVSKKEPFFGLIVFLGDLLPSSIPHMAWLRTHENKGPRTVVASCGQAAPARSANCDWA